MILVNNGALSQKEVHIYGSSRLSISTRVTNMQDSTEQEPVDLPRGLAPVQTLTL